MQISKSATTITMKRIIDPFQTAMILQMNDFANINRDIDKSKPRFVERSGFCSAALPTLSPPSFINASGFCSLFSNKLKCTGHMTSINKNGFKKFAICHHNFSVTAYGLFYNRWRGKNTSYKSRYCLIKKIRTLLLLKIFKFKTIFYFCFFQ